MTARPRPRRCAKPEVSAAIENLEARFLLAGDAGTGWALSIQAPGASVRAGEVMPVGDNTAPVAGDDVFTTWIERVSLRFNQRQVNDYSYGGAASADGRYVAFESWAPLVPDDANVTLDVYVLDRLTGTLERVSVSSSGEEAAGGSYGPSISADGRYVGFVSEAPNLVADDTN
ncbi:MAG: hypothetical protein NT031_10965, partial [Planctomycetota bacterium]|nr:hypothetical protein [Planctomycetota bacterium]